MTNGLVSIADLLRDPDFLKRLIPPDPERDTNPTGARLSYRELEARDDRLVALRRRVEAVRRSAGGPFCPHTHWFGRSGGDFKRQLVDIIGWHSANPDAALRTSDAYEVAYQHLYHLLPDCRHDGMCGPYR